MPINNHKMFSDLADISDGFLCKGVEALEKVEQEMYDKMFLLQMVYKPTAMNLPLTVPTKYGVETLYDDTDMQLKLNCNPHIYLERATNNTIPYGVNICPKKQTLSSGLGLFFDNTKDKNEVKQFGTYSSKNEFCNILHTKPC